jgi:hypothetical protein
MLFAVMVFLFGNASAAFSASGASGTSLDVYVVADSVSTSMEAHRIIRQKRWTEVPLRQAYNALVVVRSTLNDPLNYSYESVSELKKDAGGQMNISGDNFVVYLYSLDEDLRPTLIHKSSYPARD